MGIYENQDQMTPKERLTAIREGKQVDRLSLNAFIGEHAAWIQGLSVSEYHHSPEKMAKAQIDAYRKYGTDGISVGVGLTGIAEALGSRIGYPDDNTPYVAEHVLKDIKEVDKLKLTDNKKDGRLQIIIDTVKILLDEVGDEVPVTAGVIGAFSNAANTRGTESFLRDIMYDPENAHKLLRHVNKCTIEFVKEVSKLGVSISIGDPTASGSLISPKQFREFAYPYIKELSDAIKEHGAPAPQLHICGNSKKIWGQMADTGVGGLSLDDVIDLEEAKKEVGDRITLIGNVSPTRTMYLGTPSDVVENVKDNLRKAYDTKKGYVISLGCGLPIRTKPENVHAFVDAAKKYGRYPLKLENFI